MARHLNHAEETEIQRTLFVASSYVTTIVNKVKDAKTLDFEDIKVIQTIALEAHHNIASASKIVAGKTTIPV